MIIEYWFLLKLVGLLSSKTEMISVEGGWEFNMELTSSTEFISNPNYSIGEMYLSHVAAPNDIGFILVVWHTFW